jgi:GxxExxY protein
MLPERFYQEAVAIGLAKKGIVCETEKQFEVMYCGVEVGRYFVDVWVEGGKILLELKVAPSINPLHKAQAISYLKVTDADLAFVVNFGEGSLVDERLPNFVRDKQVPFEWTRQVALPDIPNPELIEKILSALHRVHFELGSGFFHQVYRRAAQVELREQQISFDYIKHIPVIYAGTILGEQETRLICVENQVLVATMAVKEIGEAMKQMMRSRMKQLDIDFGLLANFNRTELEVRLVRV